MKIGVLLCLLTGLPVPALAWELINPADPGIGAVTTTTITDILAVRERTWGADSAPNTGYWIAFADSEVIETCRAMGEGQLPADSPNPSVAAAYTYAGRYVWLEHQSANGAQLFLPMALFAQAHGMRVRVKIKYTNTPRCAVEWLQTCTGPNSCVAP